MCGPPPTHTRQTCTHIFAASTTASRQVSCPSFIFSSSFFTAWRALPTCVIGCWGDVVSYMQVPINSGFISSTSFVTAWRALPTLRMYKDAVNN